jgi:hypothetical protein
MCSKYPKYILLVDTRYNSGMDAWYLKCSD